MRKVSHGRLPESKIWRREVSKGLQSWIRPVEDAGAEGLLKAADQAMHAAKGAGRNRVRFFTPDLQERAQHRLCLTREMRVAVQKKQFFLVFQPTIALGTGRCVKAEALLRWTV